MSEEPTQTGDKPKSERVHVNMVMRLNASMAREETRKGRKVIVAPCKCMRGGDVLNGILYPNEIVRECHRSFEGVQVPFGHPYDEQGRFIPARSNEALNEHFMGGHMENVRFELDAGSTGIGRIHGEIVIDVARAKTTKGGKRTLAAFEAGDPISTSTGIFLDMVATPGAEGHQFECTWFWADHNAILLDEEPAASTEEGTGVFVNRKGEVQTLRTFTVNMSDVEAKTDDSEPEPPAEGGSDDISTNQLTGIVKAVMKAISGNRKEAEMADDATKGEGVSNADLAKRVENLEGNTLTKEEFNEMLGNALKPLIEANEITAKANAEAEANERKELTEKVVAANIAGMTNEDCAEMPMASLRKLAGNAGETKGDAAPVQTNSKGDDGGEFNAGSIANRMNGKSEDKSNG